MTSRLPRLLLLALLWGVYWYLDSMFFGVVLGANNTFYVSAFLLILLSAAVWLISYPGEEDGEPALSLPAAKPEGLSSASDEAMRFDEHSQRQQPTYEPPFCRDCGVPITATMRFCPNCSSPTDNKPLTIHSTLRDDPPSIATPEQLIDVKITEVSTGQVSIEALQNKKRESISVVPQNGEAVNDALEKAAKKQEDDIDIESILDGKVGLGA